MYNFRSLCYLFLALNSFLPDDSLFVNARFQMQGPVLTLTLRDPLDEMTTATDDPASVAKAKWFNIYNLKPNLSWTLASKGKPLPHWAPAWESLSVSAMYDHALAQQQQQQKQQQQKIPMPTQLEAMASIQVPSIDTNLQIQPIWNLSRNLKTLLVQVQKGPCQLLAKVLANQGLAAVKGCWQSPDDWQYGALGGIRITPQYDLTRHQPSCKFEATTSTQQTKTVLHLEHHNPTLKIVHALDDRHVIAPEISLYNAKITYQWDLKLNSGSLRTLVDPTKAIQMTWTDLTPTGKWVTDVRLPLVGTTWKQLAADVRVRRQFQF